MEVSKVKAYHLLGEALSSDEKPGHVLRGVLQEATLDEVGHALFRLLVEDVEASAVVTLSDNLALGVAAHCNMTVIGGYVQ